MSAFYRQDGNILLGCNDGVKLFHKNNMSVTTFDTTFKNVTSVVEYRSTVYVLHREGDICKVEMCLPDMKSSYKLFEFKRDGNLGASMTVSDNYIVVDDPDHDWQLIVYDIISKEKKFKNPATSSKPFFLPDGDLLVLRLTLLSKYSLQNEALKEIRPGLKNVISHCTDEDGLIYAATFKKERVLNIISPDGNESLHQFYNFLCT